MMRSDYSRAQDEVKSAKEAAEAKQQEANNTISEWTKWYNEEFPKNERYLSEKEEAERKLVMLNGYLASQGINPLEVDTTKPPVAEPFDLDKVLNDPKFKQNYVPREEAQQSLQAVMQINDLQHQINLRHRKLVGTDIDDFATLRNEAFAAKKPLDAYADEKYQFTAKEQALADKALEDRAERMAQEKLAALISKQGIPQPQGDMAEEGANLFGDQFTNNTKVSEGEADRAAIERAMRFDMENQNHAAQSTGVV